MYKLRVLKITITTAGIPVAGPDLQTKKVQILAPATNSGAVYYGSDGLTAGIYRSLAAGSSDPHEAPNGGEIDLASLRFDAATSGDKVTLIYYEWQPSPDPVYLMPNEVAGLVAWWKADALSLSNNDPVENWDSSGGLVCTLTADTSMPTFQTNVQNGLPGVYWDGEASNNAMYSDTISNLGLYTVFCAAKFESSVVNFWDQIWALQGTDQDYDMLRVKTSGSNYVVERNGVKIGVRYTEDFQLGDVVLTTVMDGTYAGTSTRRNGSVLTPTVISGGNLNPGSHAEDRTMEVGANLEGDYPMQGHYLEIAVFNRALSAASIAAIEAYLKDKWALY